MVRLRLDKNGNGAFYMMQGGERVAEMVISTDSNQLTVYNIDVSSGPAGKKQTKKMLEVMVTYARRHKLNVVALCLYIPHAMRHNVRI